MELGNKGLPVTIGQLSVAAEDTKLAKAFVGNAMEALVNELNLAAEPSAGSFRWVGRGGYRIDFVGTGSYHGYTFELTTEAGVVPHSSRLYMREPGAMIFTYTFD